MIEQALIMTLMGMTMVFLVLSINAMLIWCIGKVFGPTEAELAPALAQPAPGGMQKQKLVAAAMAAVRLYEEENENKKS